MRRSRVASPASVLSVLVLWAPLSAQTGSWEPGFNHEITGATATDYLLPFRGTGFVEPPTPPPVGQPQRGSHAFLSGYLYWGQGNFQEDVQTRPFNSTHMALIPKGPHQGKVLVFGSWFPVMVKPNSTLESNNDPQRFWMCQPWSIIDVTVTNPGPGNPRFRNFLFPLRTFQDPTVGVQPPSFPIEFGLETWFCSGHAWTPEGDLLVVGGSLSTFDFSQYLSSPGPQFPHPVLVGTGIGARRTFLFDPSRPSQPPLGQTTGQLYNEVGRWDDSGPNMVENRWYATATITQPMQRLNLQDLVMIAGGIDKIVGTPSMPENSYETYTIRPSTNPLGFLGRDPDPTPGTSVVLAGPDDPATTNILLEQLSIYPRLHVLSDDTLFLSGPGGMNAKVDQNVTAIPTGNPLPAPQHVRPWTSIAHTSPIPFREDGSNVLMHTLGDDFVLRVGGDDPVTSPTAPVATDLVELCHANAQPPPQKWVSFGHLPSGPRVFTNAVVLPDMSVLVLGGRSSRGGSYVMAPDVYRPGLGWTSTNAPSPTRRGYHSTTVLLPDGRVFVGGGELDTPQSGNERDYDIYVPHYLQGNPQRPTFVALTDVNDVIVPFNSGDNVDILDRQLQQTLPRSFRVKFDDIGELDQLEKVVLMAPGSITHHSDMSARYVDISGTALSSNARQFTMPRNGAVPRGFYMLFGLNSAGVPSVARWVKVL